MSPLPWNKKGNEPDLDDLLDELPPSLDRDDKAERAVASNEEEALLDQYVNSESLAVGMSDTESDVVEPDDRTAPDLSHLSDSDEEENASDSDDVADDVMSIFDDDVEQDEDLAALSRGLEEVDVTELLGQARSVGRELASRGNPG